MFVGELTADACPHLAAVTLKRRGHEATPRHLRDQGDHLGTDGLMIAPAGIAKADHLDPIFLLKQGVSAAVTGDIGPLCPKELWCWLGTAGGDEGEEEKGFHRQSVVHGWLRLG